MEETRQETVKEIVTHLLERMGFQASIEVSVEDGVSPIFLCMARVETDQNFLIGQYGANLAAIQHLVRMLLYKKTQERLNVIVDVNNYLSNKRASLEEEAQKAAQEALRDRISVMLRPMFPYERKIIHTFLAKNQDVVTESVGKNSERKIIIRPKPIVDAS